MADSLACLRGLVTGEIANICNSLSLEPSEDFYPLGTLEKIDQDQVIVAINFLDLVVRLHEEVYLDISVARRIIENLSSASVRTRQINSSRPGHPSYEISTDHLQSLIDLRFTVPQISRLLYVSTRTIDQRLAEYGISSRSFSTSRMRSWMAR